MFYSSHSITGTDSMRNHRTCVVLAREYAFIHRQYKQVVKIEATGFEYTHYLQSFQWQPFKLHTHAACQTLYQMENGFIFEVDPCIWPKITIR